jgi:lantibiotic biosynthesis protein
VTRAEPRSADDLSAAALAAARRLGEQLVERSRVDGDGISWLSPDPPPRPGDPVPWRPLEGLYDGTAGIALFLAELAGVTGEGRFRTATEAAVRWLLGRWEEPAVEPGGFYLGRASTCWTLARWAQIGGDEELLRRALELALGLAHRIAEPGSDDVLTGRSGLALLLARLHAATGEPALEAALRDYAGTMAGRAWAGPEGLAWGRSRLSAHPLCGLAHGAAGCGLALVAAAGRTAAPGAAWLARQAFLYEEARAAEAPEGRWPDLRRDDVFLDLEERSAGERAEPRALVAPRAMSGWCAGPAGIGLSRLAAYRLWGDATSRRQAERALALVRREMDAEPPRDLTLCHGLCGDGELFLEAAEVLADGRHRASAEEVARRLLDAEAAEPGSWWRAARRDALAGDPGLFLGAAGIGHFLLRLATHGAVPSIAQPAPSGGCPPAVPGGGSPSAADCRHAVLRATFPAIVERLERAFGDDLTVHLAAHGERDLDGDWTERFISWAASRLPPEDASLLALAARRRRIDLAVDNDALLAYRALRRRRRGQALAALADAQLLALDLRMPPHLELWCGGDGDGCRLLEPDPSGVREVPLSQLAQAVLAAYGEGRSGERVTEILLAGWELSPADEAELRRRIAAQVRAAVARGLLEERPG